MDVELTEFQPFRAYKPYYWARPSNSSDLKANAIGVLNFFFYQVPPLHAALWQSRPEPVKGLR